MSKNYDASCFYCTEDERQTALMEKICELAHSNVFFFRDQKNPGRCIIACKEHIAEYYKMPDEMLTGFMREMAAVTRAIDELYHPDKINYATYGDLVTHLHMHLVPKYKDGVGWGGPFVDNVEKVFLPEEAFRTQLDALKRKILEYAK